MRTRKKRVLSILLSLSIGTSGAIFLREHGKSLFMPRHEAVVSETNILLSWEGRTNVERGLPGICVSFDDGKVDNWFEYLRPLSDKYGAKFTLFVSAPDKLTNDELGKLKTMQTEGHEIGCHTWRHSSAIDMVNADSYMENEIIPWFEFMDKKGFKREEIISFAHPHGQENGFLELKLVKEEYCQVLRLINSGNPSLVFYNWKRDSLVKNHHPIYAWGIDRKHNLEDEEIIKTLKKTQSEGLVLILYAHDPTPNPEGKDHRDYSVSPDRLELIAKTARDLNLKFYQVRDLQRQPSINN